MSRAASILGVVVVGSIAVAACGGSTETGFFDSAPAVSGSGDTPPGTAPPGTPPGAAPPGTPPGTPPPPAPDAGDVPCTVGKAVCGAGNYCQRTSCSAEGVCRPRATSESRAFAPVCGCDGVTYWNAEIASRDGVSVATDGVCPAESAQACAQNSKCARQGSCAFERASAVACAVPGLFTGTCWKLPTTCPVGGGSAASVQLCNEGECAGLCEAIRSETPYHSQNLACD